MLTSLISVSPEILTLSFLAITFLQSGIDKIIDFKGNLEFISGHFAKSPLGPLTPVLLAVLTLFEFSAGLLSGLGVIDWVFSLGWGIGIYGAVLAAISLLMLLFGQRMAKDYDGAAVLPGYFLVAIAAVFLHL